jgi:two-component system cell cycle response regulator
MDILVISNDLVEHSVVQQVLERSGHAVYFSSSVDEAWEDMQEKAFRFVIVDATANIQSVQEFVQNIRSSSDIVEHVYLLLLTNKGQNGELIAGLGTGADDYLTKPIVPQDLKARVLVGLRLLNLSRDLEEARNQLEGVPVYDPLTGLVNREAFYIQAKAEMERARRASAGVSFIVMDVDNFKAINEQFGRGIGDEVLQIATHIIREKSRPYDCIGRWAGDQFSIVLPGVLSSDAEKIANRILTGIRSSGITLEDGTALEIKLSAGIATTQTVNAYANVDAFIQSAVQAMNTAQEDKEVEINILFL